MKTATIEIKFPDIYKKEEIIKSIMDQLDIDSFNQCGVKFFVSKDIDDWFK